MIISWGRAILKTKAHRTFPAVFFATGTTLDYYGEYSDTLTVAVP